MGAARVRGGSGRSLPEGARCAARMRQARMPCVAELRPRGWPAIADRPSRSIHVVSREGTSGGWNDRQMEREAAREDLNFLSRKLVPPSAPPLRASADKCTYPLPRGCSQIQRGGLRAAQ